MHSVRSQYVASAVATVGPARLLTMLYDRMLLDVDRGVEALAGGRPRRRHRAPAARAGDRRRAHGQPAAATAGTAARSSCRSTATCSPSSSSAGAHGDAERAGACRDLVLPLADAWHDAADELARAASRERRRRAADHRHGDERRAARRRLTWPPAPPTGADGRRRLGRRVVATRSTRSSSTSTPPRSCCAPPTWRPSTRSPAAAAWHPRADLGPLPAALEVRARALLDRQLDTARRTAEAITRSRRQLAATRALQAPAGRAAAVYVDDEA